MTITIPVASCCGALPGDVCECAQQAAEVRAALMSGLVDRARTGDREAFGEVYAYYRATVFRSVLRRVSGNRQLAEDLTSETFARALASIGKFTWQGRDLGAWLVTIARNLVVDHFKSAYSRMQVPVDPDGFAKQLRPDADRRVDPERVAEHNETSALLDQVIAKLSLDQRRVLALRFGEGLSVAETAAVMRRDQGAIKALQYRATQSLRRVLTGDSPLSERH